MELRLAVLKNLWSDPKIIPDTITRLKTFGHHGIILITIISSS